MKEKNGNYIPVFAIFFCQSLFYTVRSTLDCHWRMLDVEGVQGRRAWCGAGSVGPFITEKCLCMDTSPSLAPTSLAHSMTGHHISRHVPPPRQHHQPYFTSTATFPSSFYKKLSCPDLLRDVKFSWALTIL